VAKCTLRVQHCRRFCLRRFFFILSYIVVHSFLLSIAICFCLTCIICLYVFDILYLYVCIHVTLCISADFVMCLEVVNQYIIKEELNLIITVYSCVFIIDKKGNEELILGRDCRIHFWRCSRLRIFLLLADI